ncbi:extracellular serine-rich protein [Metarhizium album ARSEF 1941]|uniref:Extracellular serine-rich protein n=1 Tax=Metarhizium album (strain ARSEF 1941) TaxID=1081103 RepID=A0A0B2WQC8_METAS|nr:extracellular serine-rich protein [Metarhizium album ARSEF 1941]KHN95834.1 extracellular serine-rich protein [Metarhizium album ARSEF 1941]
MSLRAITNLLVLATAVSAGPAPSNTTPDSVTKTTTLTGVTHSVVAGLGGLRFDPDNVVAEIGDIVEWHFLPANYSLAQSSFVDPCKPLAPGTGFFPGFEFATKEGQAPNVFQLEVKDKTPIWYYCPQREGSHCQRGMAGVINQNYDDPNVSLRRYKEMAALTGQSIVPAVNGVGRVIPNPNPNGGF